MQLTQVLRETSGLEPKGRGCVYQNPYPVEYDQIPYPRNYRVPDFSKFNGEDGKTTLEHVGQFTLQCGQSSSNDMLKLRMFPLSLSETAFTWFSLLALNSIFSWAQLEQKFCEYFFLEIMNYDCHASLQLSKTIMNMLLIILGGLEKLETIALI